MLEVYSWKGIKENVNLGGKAKDDSMQNLHKVPSFIMRWYLQKSRYRRIWGI